MTYGSYWVEVYIMANWTLIAFKLHEEVGGSPLKGMSAGMKKILTGSRFSQIGISSVGTLWAGGEALEKLATIFDSKEDQLLDISRIVKKNCQVVLKNTVGKLYE